jgi:excisionase family DNA binding protein
MKKSAYTSYDELPLVISVPEIAKILGIAVAGAYELVKQPGFPAFSVGSRILVPKEKFIAWMDTQTLEKSAKNV